MLSRSGTQSLLRCLRQFQIPAAYSSTQSGTTQKDLPSKVPRPVRLDTDPPTVFNIIPKSWFDFLYPKTGVTGPYMLLTGVGTWIFSKEIFVVSPEAYIALSYVCICILVHKLYGNQIKEFIYKGQDEEKKNLMAIQDGQKQFLKDAILNKEKSLWSAQGVAQYLPEAKKENVYLQMEAAYRARLQEAFLAVKKVLDYQVEKENVERRIAQRNMVDYVIKNVEQSITPQLKKNVLKQCLGDLKALAAKV